MPALCEMPECNHRLSLVERTTNKCRCSGTYCKAHRSPEDHLCKYDYKDAAKDKLAAALQSAKTTDTRNYTAL